MMQAQTAPIEYTVYTFDLPSSPQQKGDTSWKRHFCSLDRELAISEAQSLLETRKFHKIEIKKKFFDQKQNRTIDMTMKVFKQKSSKNPQIIAAGGVIMLCAAILFASLFLT